MPVRLFVGNLPYDATEAEVKEFFSAAGTVSYVHLPVDRETNRPRGFAFVEYADRLEAAHVRHEDVDQHDVEGLGSKLAHSRLTTVGNGDFHALPFQADFDGHRDHRIVVDH